MKKFFFQRLLIVIGLSLAGSLSVMAAGQTNTQTDRVPASGAEKIKKGSKQGKPPPRKISNTQFGYVRGNLIATLYHEFGHVLIDELDLPVFGQEEDAADVLSVVMLDRRYKGPELMRIALDTAHGFEADAKERERTGEEWAWSDVHGPDWQRYYNFICLFYGKDPDNRVHFAKKLGLPSDRMESCEDEEKLASKSWGQVLDRVASSKPGDSIVFSSRTRTDLQKKAADIVSDEVTRLNKSFVLPKKLRVVVKHCGEDSSLSAFYTSGRVKITVCTEYIDQLYDQAAKQSHM